MEKIGFKISVIAVAISLTVVSCGSGSENSNKRQNAENEQQEIAAQEVQKSETKQERTDWLGGDFKLSYEEKPMAVFAGISD